MASDLLLPLSWCSRRLLYLNLGNRPVAGIKVAFYCRATHTGAAIVEQVYSFSMLVEAGGARGDWAAASQWIRGFHHNRCLQPVWSGWSGPAVRRALVAFCLVGWYSFVAMEYTAILVAAH